MGCYATLLIGSMEFCSWEGGYPESVGPFAPSDYVELLVPCQADEDAEQGHLRTHYTYKTTAQTAARRMNVLGFTYSKAVARFEESRETAPAEHRGPFRRLRRMGRGSVFYDKALARACLKSLTFSYWSEEVCRYVQSGQRPRLMGRRLTRADRLRRFIFDFDESVLGFRHEDDDHAMRAALEIVPSDTAITLDLTELVEEGYVTGPRQAISAPAPLVLLTEGSTDRRVIEFALSRLAPETAHLFSFLDPSEIGLHGGASGVVLLLKALASARVVGRYLAVLDNDSAANDAVQCLRNRLPGNIAIMMLPDLDYCRSYPCLGPSGRTLDDINGRAVSIEHFLGESCLTDEHGALLPVQWTSLMPGIKVHQGELQRKREVGDAFWCRVNSGNPVDDRHLKALVDAIHASAAAMDHYRPES